MYGIIFLLFALLLSPFAGASAIHLVVEVEGAVTLQRPAWQREAPLVFGAQLQLGNLIRLVDASAGVTLLCADLSVVVISGTTLSSVACPQETPILHYRDSPISALRAPSPDAVPSVVSPRNTLLLTDRPMFTWRAVPGASSYTVTLKKLPGEVVWRRESLGNALSYPLEAPLERGVPYIFEVEAHVGGEIYSSAVEGVLNLRFQALDDEAVGEVEGHQAAIEALALSDVARAFAVARLYGSLELYAEAAETLEAVAGAVAIFAFQYALGELYLATLLPEAAEGHFETALALAQRDGHVEGQAGAHVQLAELADVVWGNSSKTKRHYEKALALYAWLGDEAKVRKMQEGMDERF